MKTVSGRVVESAVKKCKKDFHNLVEKSNQSGLFCSFQIYSILLAENTVGFTYTEAMWPFAVELFHTGV